ncbi:hypothetical protein Pint_24112 [Pistacia integerrima]|uniref:Uncharacterized protein n=1 Tax=Pistacia integerrima TaxID=434235 RepID=A0ACC0YH33_9ROSI|nr:hypothetical protein Pint_24112 [Pistacia integerrima]
MDDFTSKQRDMATTFISQKPSFRQTVKHFSHQHPLRPFEPNDQDEIICSGCELDISSPPAYKCTNSNCDYFLHKSCFKLPRELQHKFHPAHSLILLSSPAYTGGRFICSACDDYGTAFNYHCSTCKYDLHVACSKLPQTLNVEHHDHPLTLFNSSSCDRGIETFICVICNRTVRKSRWVYYCPDCDYGMDICCANSSKEESTYSSSSTNRCTKSNCGPLYKSCLKLPWKLQHEMHPDHPLALFPTPAYASGGFRCNACDETGTRFNYHCSDCKYDLHIACSKLPQTMKLEDHEHPLKLFNSSIFGDLICDICDQIIPKNRWVYNCCDGDCDYGVEVRCVTAVDDTKDRDEESREKPNCTQESIIKYSLSQVENQLRMLQVQNETKFQTETQIISEMRRNMAKLIN